MNDAIGEINEFWRKLIAWFEDLLRFFLTNCSHAFQFSLILVSILQPKLALRANKIVVADVSGAETARERRQAFTWEPHDCGGHFFDFGKTLFAVIRGQSDDLDWLVAKQVARCVDAINADVEESASTEVLSGANVALFYLHTK